MCWPLSQGSAVGGCVSADACDQVDHMVKLQLATRVSPDRSLASWTQTRSQGPAHYFDSTAEKTKAFFTFQKRKKNEKTTERESERENERREGGRRAWRGEKNSSTSAPASLVPYARLRGRKYPQFNVIREEAAWPIEADLVELIGQPLRSGPYRLNVPHILTPPPPPKYMFHFHTERCNHSK